MKKRLLLAAAVLGIAAAPAAWTAWQHQRADDALVQRLNQRVPAADAGPVLPCVAGAEQPLVLLVLGQSNAGNHGAIRGGATPEARVFAQGRCHVAADPLPGATGRGGSIWTRLPDALRRRGATRPLLLVPLAVDATQVDDWVREGSPLTAQLRGLLRSLRAAQVQPDFVLWQQGEADAQRGTSGADYAAGIDALRSLLRAEQVHAPILLAVSTQCRGADGRAVRDAVLQAPQRHADIALGPDTDSLRGPYRADGCHFSALGLEAAADEWAGALVGRINAGAR